MYSDAEFVKFVRSHFPFFANNKENWALFENAGGSQTLSGVIDRIVKYLSEANVQLRAHNALSDECMRRTLEGVRAVGLLVNAQDPEREICLGSSSTQLLFNLSHAMEPTIPEGSEIILTNCDHETNIGCWRQMALRKSLLVNEWKINPDTFELEIEALEDMLNENTRLVAFTHCSNVLGTINPVEEYVRVIRAKAPNATIVIDGVALAAHRMVDVQAIGADFYVYSNYKAYGPHIAALYGKREAFEALQGINHFYVLESPRNIQPGNFTYEFAYSLPAINEYFVKLAKRFTPRSAQKSEQEWMRECFKYIAVHEEVMSRKLLDFLHAHDNIKVIGSDESSNEKRVPTISFVVRGFDSKEICDHLSKKNVAAKYGECYCKRMTDYLDLPKNYGSKNGVVRISMVHYNSLEDVDRLIHELGYYLKHSTSTEKGSQ